MKGSCRSTATRGSNGALRLLTLVALAVSAWVSGIGASARAEDNADQNLYLDYVAGSWDDWSWDTTRKWDPTEHVRSFDRAGKLTFTKAWGAVRLHFRGGADAWMFNTTGFSDLQFSVHWGDAAPMQMLIYALRKEDFNRTTKLDLLKYSLP